MGREKTLTAVSTNTRKRKSTGSIDDVKPKPTKQPRKTLDTFFSPQVLATGCPKDEKATREHVALNEEQIKVLRMVVEEEQNVFFTGSAGELFLLCTRTDPLCRSWGNGFRISHKCH